MMRRLHRHCWLPLLAVAALTGCGRQPAPVLQTAQAQPSIPAAPSAPPAPLSEAEILQYLQVMREAAQRVQHPTTAERKMLARADAITAAANRGDNTVSGTHDDGTLTQALAFRMQLDLQVAKAQHLDPAQYLALSERIEDESGELYCHPDLPVPDPLLKPHVREVERLVGIVRNRDSAGLSRIPSTCAHG